MSASETKKLLEIAKQRLDRREFSECQETLSQITDPSGYTQNFYTLNMLCSIGQKNWPNALDAVNHLAEKHGENDFSRVYRALCYSESGSLASGRDELAKVDMKLLAINLRQIVIYILLTLFDDVDEGVKLGLEYLDEVSIDVLKVLLDQTVRKSRPRDTWKIAGKILSKFPKDSAAHFAMFRLSIQAGEVGPARYHLKHVEKPTDIAIRDRLPGDLKRLEELQCIYMHIPKTGGTATAQAIEPIGISIYHRGLASSGNYSDASYYGFYEPAFVDLASFKGKRVVTNIRNIYPMLLSYYFDARRWFLFDFLLEDTVFAQRHEFKDFVKYLSEKENGWICRDLIYFPCFSQPDGKLAVDWINRLEYIDQDMKALEESLGVTTHREVEVANQKVTDDYRNYYDEDTIALVQETWADDIRLFGFKFDGTYAPTSLLHRDVSAMKGRIRYSLTDKALKIEPGLSEKAQEVPDT